MSRPSRARGLKLSPWEGEGSDDFVAPFTGAWIETGSCASASSGVIVAPFTGAWIETGATGRARTIPSVAPFTGAWIETPLTSSL